MMVGHRGEMNHGGSPRRMPYSFNCNETWLPQSRFQKFQQPAQSERRLDVRALVPKAEVPFSTLSVFVLLRRQFSMSERHWSFRGRFPAFVLLLGLLCLRTVSWSQATQGSIVGNVKDSAGAVVAGAAVTLTNIDEGVARTTQSNRTGDYAFLDAKAAHYTLTVEAPGFEKFEAKDVTLEVRQELRLDAKLAVGAVQQQVEVNGDA